MFRKVFFGLLLLMILFVVWMNVTPGRFQYIPISCDQGYIGYIQNKDITPINPKIVCGIPYRQGSLLDYLLLFLEKIDFNK